MNGRKKKILWSLGVLLALAGGFFGLVFWLGDEGPISPAGFARLRPGMTRAEVQHILGSETELSLDQMSARMAVDLLDGLRWIPDKEWGNLQDDPSLVRWRCWQNERYCIQVIFDAHDQAAAASLSPVPRATFWQRFRRWLSGA